MLNTYRWALGRMRQPIAGATRTLPLALRDAAQFGDPERDRTPLCGWLGRKQEARRLPRPHWQHSLWDRRCLRAPEGLPQRMGGTTQAARNYAPLQRKLYYMGRTHCRKSTPSRSRQIRLEAASLHVAVRDPEAFLQCAKTLKWRHCKPCRDQADGAGPLQGACEYELKEFWLPVSDYVVAPEAVAETTREGLELQGALSAIASIRTRQHERYWQIQLMMADIPGEWGM